MSRNALLSQVAVVDSQGKVREFETIQEAITYARLVDISSIEFEAATGEQVTLTMMDGELTYIPD